MNKKIKVIRDLSLVEKELSASQGGVVAVSLQKENFAQFATNFVYQNKNIFSIWIMKNFFARSNSIL